MNGCKHTEKTHIITGYYGSGKTEFCLNLALDMRKRLHGKIYIADLDVINPYFRSREKAAYLAGFDIEVMGSALGNDTGQDIPAISYGFLPLIAAGEAVIIDLAGSEHGLNVLAHCYDVIKDYELLCVLNLYRPETDTAEGMLRFIDKVNEVCKLPVTGIVNNSHMLRETTPEHILSSQEVILSVCERLRLPLRYTQLGRGVYEQVKGRLMSDDVVVFDRLQMREDWQ